MEKQEYIDKLAFPPTFQMEKSQANYQMSLKIKLLKF